MIRKSETNFKSWQAKQNDVDRENSYSGIIHEWEKFLSQRVKPTLPCPSAGRRWQNVCSWPRREGEDELISGLVGSL